MRRETVELSDVLRYPLALGHPEILEVVLRSSGRIVRSEIDPEFVLEGLVGVEEQRGFLGVAFEEVRLEPLERGALEV